MPFGKRLLRAACKGNTNIVDLLLKCDGIVDINYKDEFGRTALHVACFKGYIDIVLLLLEYSTTNNNTKNATIDIDCANIYGETPLHMACNRGKIDIIKVLIEKGNANVNSITIDGETPLHSAVKTCFSFDVIQLLLQKGCNVNAKTYDEPKQNLYKHNNYKLYLGYTPLHFACKMGHVRIVQLLLQHGANTNCHASVDGSTPLHIACSKGHTIELIQLLLDHHGSNINSKGMNNKRPLDCAIESCQYNIVNVLLNNGANISNRSSMYNNIPISIYNIDSLSTTPTTTTTTTAAHNVQNQQQQSTNNNNNIDKIMELIHQKKQQLRCQNYAWLLLYNIWRKESKCLLTEKEKTHKKL